MKIAATYENGMIFQHFGKCEEFKIYETEGEKVVSSAVVSSGGTGHSALAGLLADLGVEVLICGGIGEGAQSALDAAGIQVVSGAEGSADEAVLAYLNGTLVTEGANCDHHHEEEHECGENGCGENCGSTCGEGCGGCGQACAPEPITGKNAGRKVSVHYRGTFDDGTQFDSSYDRGQPLVFICGGGQMIHGFDKAVAEMEVGQVIDVHLMPEEAYGPSNPRMIFTVQISQMPGSENLSEGNRVHLMNEYGQRFPVTVTFKDDENITFDANHQMAGKELNFRIELLEVSDN